jgi:hypothetical protein
MRTTFLLCFSIKLLYFSLVPLQCQFSTMHYELSQFRYSPLGRNNSTLFEEVVRVFRLDLIYAKWEAQKVILRLCRYLAYVASVVG